MLTTVKEGASPKLSHVTSTYLSSISLGELGALLADTEVVEPKERIDKTTGNIHKAPAKPSNAPVAPVNPAKATTATTGGTVGRNKSGTSTGLFTIPPGAGGVFKPQISTGSRAAGAGVDFGAAPTFGDGAGLFRTAGMFGTQYAAGAVGAETGTGAIEGLGTSPAAGLFGRSVTGATGGSFLPGTAATTGTNPNIPPVVPTPVYKNPFEGTPTQNKPPSTSSMK